MAVRAVIFDLDGTLLDSTGVWADVDRAFFGKRGLPVPDDYTNAVSALGFYETALYTIRRFSLPDSPEALLDEWNRLAIQAYSTTVPLKPYAKEYLQHLRAKGYLLAVATGAPPALYEPALRNHGLYDWFTVICSTKDVTRGKECPDLFLHTAARLGVAPDECLVFEDIWPAIRSAKQAGMQTCGVYDEGSRDVWEAIRRTADGVITDFRDAPLW